jgi:hypothetical protein
MSSLPKCAIARSNPNYASVVNQDPSATARALLSFRFAASSDLHGLNKPECPQYLPHFLRFLVEGLDGPIRSNQWFLEPFSVLMALLGLFDLPQHDGSHFTLTGSGIAEEW